MKDGIAHVIGGGTVFHVRPHLALSAPAYGAAGRKIHQKLLSVGQQSVLHLTRMAGGDKLETNADVSDLVNDLVSLKDTKAIFLTAALCDFEGTWGPTLSPEVATNSGKGEPRLRSDAGGSIALSMADKIVSRIRKERKDIFLVACKTTAGATPDEQFVAALTLLKKSSCNLVLANDVHTRRNMIITPEQARYGVTTDRDAVLSELVAMSLSRSEGHFTRSTVVPGDSIPWGSPLVWEPLRKAVEHCIAKGAYKPFLGSTVGHFAARLNPSRFLTSKRKTDFNRLKEVGMVMIDTYGPDEVTAHGARPSVGGQSQRIIFSQHPGVDCIVHFHCPLRAGSEVPVRPQWRHECGSHECGQNTSDGLKSFGSGIRAVYLDKHGPNIAFSNQADPAEIIEFIDRNFDLSRSTDELDRTLPGFSL